MYFLCIVGIRELEAYPLRWIMVVLFYFMHLAFLLRTALILCFITLNAREVSVYSSLLKKKKKESPVLAFNILAPLVSSLLRHFY